MDIANSRRTLAEGFLHTDPVLNEVLTADLACKPEFVVVGRIELIKSIRPLHRQWYRLHVAVSAGAHHTEKLINGRHYRPRENREN
jgi:hypothetical protein